MPEPVASSASGYAEQRHVPIRLIVLRDDPRARALLADVARRLGLGTLAPDAHGDVYVAVEPSPAGDAWERVRAALDAAGEDWWEYLHLPPHGASARTATPSP